MKCLVTVWPFSLIKTLTKVFSPLSIISFILFLLSIQLFILIFLGYDTGEIYQEKILEPFFIINFVTYYRDTNICINNDYSFLFGPYVILSVILIITIFKTISFFKHNFNHKP